MPKRSTLAPLECSEGTRPSQAISWRGLAKRRKSPTSATSTTAERRATPRIACRAATTGASDQPATSSRICASRRSRRRSASSIASIGSCSTACCAGCPKRSPASQRRCAGDHVVRPVKTRSWRSRKPCSCWRARRTASMAAVRARTRSRIASCVGSGIQTAVSSPARCSRARVRASRRFVFTRSPGLRGTSDGATTVQAWPRAVTWRWRP